MKQDLGSMIDSMTRVRSQYEPSKNKPSNKENHTPKAYKIGVCEEKNAHLSFGGGQVADAADIIIHVPNLDVEKAYVQYTPYNYRLTKFALCNAMLNYEEW